MTNSTGMSDLIDLMGLQDLTIEQLEAHAQNLTQKRQQIRTQGVAVQQVLSQKLEQQRISQLLGRPVQVIDASGVESAEKAGDVGMAK